MAKICFPHYERGEFGSLQEAVEFLRNSDVMSIYLSDIVQYNIHYRNMLRNVGMERFIEQIVEEAPVLATDKKTLNRLRQMLGYEGSIAEYDIQCYNIRDCVKILGHTFYGLNDILAHVEMFGRTGVMGIDCSCLSEVTPYNDVHIGQLYERYPVFDSFDLSDGRTYQNYIFRSEAIVEDDIRAMTRLAYKSNYRMVHEDVPESLLPMLYYEGDGNYMLLASKKE